MSSLELLMCHSQLTSFSAVLNLPNTASQNEIRERYRALSVIFHPDKQYDERTKDTASSKFLEIQKAYEVLSDPFLRVVYDHLGKAPHLLSHTGIYILAYFLDTQEYSAKHYQIKAVLNQWKIDRRQEILQELLRPRGSVTCAVDASSLFAHRDESKAGSRNVLDRICGVRVSGFAKALGPKTTIELVGHAHTGSRNHISSNGTLTGTLRHQFSPRFVHELTAAFLHPHNISAKTTYQDDENAVSIQTHFFPAYWHSFPPLTTLSFGRRLFRDSLTQGSATWTYFPWSPAGRLQLDVYSPQPFDLTSLEDFTHTGANFSPDGRPGSTTGFATGQQAWAYGLVLSGLRSCITTEYSVFFEELALRLKASVEISLTGAVYLLTAKWSGDNSAFSTSVGVGNRGVIMRFELSYLQQKWMLPVTLSPDNDEVLALYTALIPSTALALGYHFFLKPRRRAQRARYGEFCLRFGGSAERGFRYFDNARRVLKDEKSELKREIENTTLLLQDPARRHTDAERAKRGNVLGNSFWKPSMGRRFRKMQRRTSMWTLRYRFKPLVHNSQVYVSGRLPKSGIQGFYDPAPASPKSLRVRYMFRGCMHYAEIPDLVPVVLPLRDHLVM
ncbi:hypothetical protein BU15DRAFT_62044 [Melanogaster broomeanus]|nr:hypothetical protein BU15DRAFT_62044 [Melanogaster broomeanus]